MEPPQIPPSSSSSPLHRSHSVAADVERPLSAQIPSSSSPSPSAASASASVSASKSSTSTALLGDFTKLHESMNTILPATKQDDSAKLGNFSRIFTRLSSHKMQVPASTTMALKYLQLGDSPSLKTDNALQGPATCAQHSAPLKRTTSNQHVKYTNQALLNVLKNLPISSDTDEPQSPAGSDSEIDPICTPATTPPSSAGKEPSPLAVMAAKAATTYATTLASKNPVSQGQRPRTPPQLFYQLYREGAFIPINLGAPRSKAQKHESLSHALVSLRATDSFLATENPAVVANGVHVFLDMSNINISFQHTLRVRHKIPDYARFVPLPSINLQFLTELLVRGRDTKVLNVGCSFQPGRYEPQYVQELRELDYRVDIRERKAVSDPSAHHRKHKSNGYSSDEMLNSAISAAVTAVRGTNGHKVRYVEDLVDETLQTRIGESVMEYFDRRGTLVIATGDAKPAKYSDGFFAYAERALKMGWNVEVVSWKSSLSATWINPAWMAQWGTRFRVIELDDYLDDLLACYA